MSDLVNNGNGYSIKQYILYKLDRTIAIVGLILIAIAAFVFGKQISADVKAIITGVIGVLGVYIGGRAGKDK